ncbi:peptidyl-prolyl cis-trans isomerase, EpsD family [Burkholderiales bacterium JOSHI_001]|nr:peptidyl-prolyl cis-trans isomerase, EpsD family [Burkholderiales bacterium JOSHI_001]
MTQTLLTHPVQVLRCPRVVATALAVAATAVLLAGCGGGNKEKGASQTAARVNKEELTVHQINFVLQQQRNIKPEQADAASKQILERLIDQELAVQKGEELKVDRDPRVVQQLEAAKREIIARAYAEKVGEAAPKPTPEELQKYYDDKPALFKDRRVYSIQEIVVEAKPDQVAAVRAKLQASKSVNDFMEGLKADNIRYAGNQAVRAAEQLPLNMLEAFAKLQDGQAMVLPNPAGLQVVFLAGSRSQPVTLEQAKPAIEQFLLNDRKRKLIADDLKAMRAAAKIEYIGKFAEGAPGAAGAASAAAAADAAASGPAAAPAATAAPAAPAASGGLDASAISKGLGIK